MTHPERKGLLNPLFKYTRGEETDIRKTFEKERKRIAAQKRTRSLDLTLGVLPSDPKKIISDGSW
jgi:hypothetical protein